MGAPGDGSLIDDEYLASRPSSYESENVRIIDFDTPLTVAINGRKSLGIVMKPDAGIAATTDDNRLSSTNTEIE